MATAGVSSGSELTPILDYVSPDGPVVIEARGLLVVASLLHLKQVSLYDAYLDHVDRGSRELLTNAIAASWVPVEVILQHCAAIDAIGLSDSRLREHGDHIAAQIAESSFAMVMRSARGMGLGTAIWWLLKQSDRLWSRLYRGGSVAVLAPGPKDAILEVQGHPLIASRFYRAAHHAFIEGLVRSCTESAYVKGVRPRKPHPHAVATAMSWV